MRVLLRLAYDGTGYSGWQIQPGFPTVQKAVEEAIQQLCGRPCHIHGAGRTDAGVHALSMPVHLDIEENELERISRGLNSKLPPSILCLSSVPVRDDFSARFDAVSRSYRYRIGKQGNPFTRFYEYQPGKVSLNTELMARAAALSTGSSSWRGFSKEGSGNATWMINVTNARIEEDSDGWSFYITADRFLRGAVRIWAGTLFRTGTGRIPPETVKKILSSGTRELSGPSLPACGLTLTNVEYANGE